MPLLLDLPVELIDVIVGYLHPGHVLNFGLTSQHAYKFLNPRNKVLWREVFLNIFEDPRKAWQRLTPTARALNSDLESQWDWFGELKRRLEVRRLMLDDEVDINTKREKYEYVAETLLDINETGAHDHKYFNYSCTQPTCRNHDFLNALFAIPKADIFIHCYLYPSDSAIPFLSSSSTSIGPTTRSKSTRRRISVAASRLHLYHGVTDAEKSSRAARADARSIVYNWKLVGPFNNYGPFCTDGTVNWRMVEAIASLMNEPIHSQAKRFSICPSEKPKIAFPRCSATATEKHSAKGDSDSSKPHDWAGLAYPNHSWKGTYAFLDYADLAWYNIERQRGEWPSLERMEEVTGLLSQLCLHLDGSVAEDPFFESTLPMCDDLPVLWFSGTSRSAGLFTGHGMRVRGRASLVPGGREVRWSFVIRYSGADQWHLEGVQPGGIRTGPIYGMWSGVEHEQHGPIGPFSYFLEMDEPAISTGPVQAGQASEPDSDSAQSSASGP